MILSTYWPAKMPFGGVVTTKVMFIWHGFFKLPQPHSKRWVMEGSRRVAEGFQIPGEQLVKVFRLSIHILFWQVFMYAFGKVMTCAASIHMQNGKLPHRKPSGSGAKELTPRQRWILKNLKFLKCHVLPRQAFSRHVLYLTCWSLSFDNNDSDTVLVYLKLHTEYVSRQ